MVFAVSKTLLSFSRLVSVVCCGWMVKKVVINEASPQTVVGKVFKKFEGKQEHVDDKCMFEDADREGDIEHVS